jgi:hypothetical protein
MAKTVLVFFGLNIGKHAKHKGNGFMLLFPYSTKIPVTWIHTCVQHHSEVLLNYQFLI